MSFGARRLAAALCGLVVCTASAAQADMVRGTRSELVRERTHAIKMTLYRDYAELVVRRTVHNGGLRHDQAEFFIDLPPGAVATGLRTLGTAGGRPRWFTGDLLEAEEAARRYRELTGIGGYYPKDPALLSWRSQTLLALQVFPCPPGEDKTVEYTLKIPTEYREGAEHIFLPPLGSEALAARVRVRAADPHDLLLIDGEPAAPASSIAWSAREPIDLAMAPRNLPRLDGELVVVPLDSARVVTRWSFQAAPKLSVVPRRAHVVVVIDGSRSIRQADAQAAKAAASAYLSHFVDAKVELLTFDRRVHRRHGRFVPVAEARRDLQKFEWKAKNGSDIDAALTFADDLLAATPAGARRVVVLTDGLSRSALRPEQLLAAAKKSGALVHIGTITNGSPALTRDDEHAWAKPVRSTGGLMWSARASAEESDAEEARRVFEEWARPVRIDHVRVFSPERAGDEPYEQTSLDEGHAVRQLTIADHALSSLRFEGELWAAPIRHLAVRDRSREALWAGLVFGTDVLRMLSEREMMTLAMRGRAVSPVTSYLAIEPGVRPSTEGLDWEGDEGIGLGSVGTLGHGEVAAAPGFIDREAFLRDALGAAWRACGGDPDHAEVELETTLDEIVDVAEVSLTGVSDASLGRCLAEAAWDLTLPAEFVDPRHTFTIRV